MLSTIVNFEKSKKIINEIESLRLQNGISILSFYEIEPEITLWELAKPTINLHVLPGIITKNKSYSFVNIIFRWIYSHIKYKISISNKENILEVLNNENLFICFTKYIENDVLRPIIENNTNNYFSYKILSDSIDNPNHLNISNFWNKNNLDRVKKIKRKTSLKSEVYQLFKIKKKFKSIGISFKDMIKVHIWLNGYFLNKYISYIITAKSIVENNKLRNLIEFDISDPKSRIFALYAKKNKINIVTIQFAFYYRDSYEWFYCISNKILTWGKWFDELFINYYNINFNKIKIVGSPRFDKYLKYDFQKIEENNEKCVLIISSYDIPAYKNIANKMDFKNYIEIITQILLKNNYKIFIKIHPLEIDTSYLNKYISEQFKVINSNDFDNVIKNVDFVISHGSSLTFSPLILGIPILYPTSENIVWWDDVFANNNLGLGFNNFEDFENLVSNYKKIRLSKNLNSDLIKSFIFFDKNESSTDKIVKLLN